MTDELAEKTPEAAEGAPRKRTVLIADDDGIVQQMLTQILEMAGGFECTVVSETHGALVQAISKPFDLLMFDRNMPPTEGDRVIRALRTGANPNRRSPMILMTAEVDHVQKGDVTRGEASIYLPKPINPGVLLEQINGLVKA